MEPRTVHLEAIGCKLNAHEVELLGSALRDAGFTVVDDPASARYVVFNSCTVTSRADAKTRNWLRAARRKSPDAVIVVTGCSAQTRAEALARLPEVDYIRGNLQKETIPELLLELEAGGTPERSVVDAAEPGLALKVSRLADFKTLSRPFIKIQDGCDNRCTYCAVPAARGPQRSSPPDDVLAQVSVFTERGFRELVLSGVHLGAYGVDLRPPTSLAALLERMLADERCPRVRLSSMEPLEFTPSVVELLARHMRSGRICRHLHVPLQSGSDRTLSRMNRRYDSQTYADLVVDLCGRVPGLAIGADVIVGFPGERAEDYAATRDLVDRLPLAYLHVFTYSERPDTPAASFPDPVQPEVRHERCLELRARSVELRRRFFESQLGQELSCVVVQAVRGRDDRFELLSDNYVKVVAPGRLEPGTLVMARPTRVQDQQVLGEVLDS